MNELLLKIKNDALLNSVPIIQDASLEVIKDIIHKRNVENIIEIGTAVAYSALAFSFCDSVKRIDTFERNNEMYEQAMNNIKALEKEDVINIHFGDALEVDLTNLEKDGDLLFIDAAKAQSQKFFERFTPFLKDDGIIIVDNILFHGVKPTDEGISKNLKHLLLKIENFVNWIKNHPLYNVTFFNGGDGLAIITKK